MNKFDRVYEFITSDKRYICIYVCIWLRIFPQNNLGLVFFFVQITTIEYILYQLFCTTKKIDN